MTERTIAELADLIERHAPSDGTHATAIDGLHLSRLSAPSEPILGVYEPSFCVIAQGRKRVLLADEVYHYDPAQYLMASVALPTAGEIIEATPERPYLGLRLGLDLGEIASLLAEVGPGAFADDAPRRALAVSPLEPGLLDVVVRLVALLDRPGDIPVLAPLARREIAYRLLTGDQRAQLRQIAAADGRSRRVVRAIRWLKDHYAEPLRIDDLARRASLSPSALHQHFRAVTALSPLQYQKQLRLQEARRLLLAEDLDAAAAGFRVGYESASQFSREYRRLFGRPPRLDVQALRSDPMTASELR